MVSVQRKKLLVGGILLLVIVLVGVVTIFVINNNRNDTETKVEVVDVVDEQIAPINDYVTPAVSEILNELISDEEKYQKLMNAAYLKVSVERYEEALSYQEEALKLGVATGFVLDQLYYELLLSSHKINDTQRVEKYTSILGPEKLAEFETPKNKEDERGE